MSAGREGPHPAARPRAPCGRSPRPGRPPRAAPARTAAGPCRGASRARRGWREPAAKSAMTSPSSSWRTATTSREPWLMPASCSRDHALPQPDEIGIGHRLEIDGVQPRRRGGGGQRSPPRRRCSRPPAPPATGTPARWASSVTSASCSAACSREKVRLRAFSPVDQHPPRPGRELRVGGVATEGLDLHRLTVARGADHPAHPPRLVGVDPEIGQREAQIRHGLGHGRHGRVALRGSEGKQDGRRRSPSPIPSATTDPLMAPKPSTVAATPVSTTMTHPSRRIGLARCGDAREHHRRRPRRREGPGTAAAPARRHTPAGASATAVPKAAALPRAPSTATRTSREDIAQRRATPGHGEHDDDGERVDEGRAVDELEAATDPFRKCRRRGHRRRRGTLLPVHGHSPADEHGADDDSRQVARPADPGLIVDGDEIARTVPGSARAHPCPSPTVAAGPIRPSPTWRRT